jgi:tetratricopeptide (TPR) repeat protein
MTPISPLTVALPLLGDPREVVAAVRRLADAWPDEVDGRLVVVAAAPTVRELNLLAAVDDVAVVVALDTDRTYGSLAVAAVLDQGSPVLLAGPDLTADDLRAAAAAEEPCWTPRWALLGPEHVGHPVLTAAVDVQALSALAEQVLAGPAPRLSPPGRRLLTASLIVKDEQGRLPACLASLRGRIDELVVCDTGSGDRTVEIAEAFGATVVHTAWTDDFAAARNVALAACTGAWVLSIDADERLVAPRRRELRAALTPRGPGALGLLIRSATDEHGEGGFAHEAVRLFRRRGVQWVGAVHESLALVAGGQPPEAVRFSGISLLHEGYLNSVHLERGKAARNLALAEKDYELARSGRSPRSLAKAAYELARAVSLLPGTRDRQEELLREALDVMPPELGRLTSSVATRLAALLRTSGRPDEAVEPARRAVSLTPSDPSAVLELAATLAAGGDAASGLTVIEAWGSRSGPASDEVVVHNAALADATLPEMKGLLLLGLGRPQEAWALLADVARAFPQLFASWPQLVEAARRAAPQTWADEVAGCCPPQPHVLLDAVQALPAVLLDELHTALRAQGIDPDEHTAEARTAREVASILEAHDDADVQAAAEALEDEDPRGALQAWSQLPWSSARQVAVARCRLALDDMQGALDALDGIEPGDLGPADRLTVAWLASYAGDRETAIALVSSLPDEVGDLAGPATELRAVLGMAPLLDRVQRSASA